MSGVRMRALQRAQRLAFPDGPIGLRRSILINLANASFYLGRLDETIATLEQHRALRQEDGSTVDAATVAFNLLNARLTQQEQRPRPGARDRLTRDAVEVLAEVERLGRPSLVAQTHRVLADLTRATDRRSRPAIYSAAWSWRSRSGTRNCAPGACGRCRCSMQRASRAAPNARAAPRSTPSR